MNRFATPLRLGAPLLAGALVLAASPYVEAAPAPARSPNFVLILADDQGWPGTSVRMQSELPHSRSDFFQTPNLERLAQRGMRFSDGYAAAPVCTPSRYAIQFGLTPARIGITRVGDDTSHFDHTRLTIPKLLKSVNPNYAAAHLGKWHMGGDPALQGYDESDGKTTNAAGGYAGGPQQWQVQTAADPKLTFSLSARAGEFMERQTKADKPFFLQISYYAVHSSLQARPETLDRYQNLPAGTVHSNAGYAAMTQDLDSGVGMVLDKLKELGIEDNTYIFYTSDNGAVASIPPNTPYERGLNFPLEGGKWNVFEGGIRVPLIVAGPGIAPHSESRVPVAGYDFLPTLGELAGHSAPLPADLDGGSFKAVLQNGGKGEVRRALDGLIFHYPGAKKGRVNYRAHSALRQDRWALLKAWENGEVRLFDLEADPGERQDLAPQLPQKAAAMEAALTSYLALVKAPMPDAIAEAPTPNGELSRGFATQFRRLGKMRAPRNSSMFLLDRRRLEAARQTMTRAQIEDISELAMPFLEVPIGSVMDKEWMPSSGDKHDYTSFAPYRWPNPDTADGLPYVTRDGERYPPADEGDKAAMKTMMAAVETLALAYFYTGNEVFAENAARRLRVWFVEAPTRMNPHLNFAQAIPGVCQGRGIGIIDTVSLRFLPDALELLRDSESWTPTDDAGVRDWLSRYTDWLLESAHGRDESNQQNNHGTWYDVQVALFALAAGRQSVAEQILRRAPRKRIASQIQPDGSQPHELRRTLSLDYSCYNLVALFDLARLGERCGLDLWNWQSENGASLRRALDFVAPYADASLPWPHPQIRKSDGSQILELLRRATYAFPNQSWANAIEKSAGRSPKAARIALFWPV